MPGLYLANAQCASQKDGPRQASAAKSCFCHADLCTGRGTRAITDVVRLHDRRGPLHTSLDSIVNYWAAHGRSIDHAAALLFLDRFKRQWRFGTLYYDRLPNLQKDPAGSDVAATRLGDLPTSFRNMYMDDGLLREDQGPFDTALRTFAAIERLHGLILANAHAAPQVPAAGRS